MSVLEPDGVGLLWFGLFAGVAGTGFYVLAGAFPLATRPDLRDRPLGLAMVALDALLLAALAGGGLAYGLAHLRWTSVVIVGGLALLFAPGLFNVWPARWRDGVAGLALVLAGLSLALGLLHRVWAVFGL